MAFPVLFYRLSKRENSTLRPSGNAAASFTCRLKDGSGVVSPVIVLDIATTDPSDWNYCYISQFSRYYYVTEWTYERGEWSASLTTDILATYRSQIGSSSLYVLRSSAAQDGTISDGMYPIRAGVSIVDTPATSNWWGEYSGDNDSINPGDGGFVVGLLSYITAGSSTFGGINYVFLTPRQMQAFLRALYTPGGNPMSMEYMEAITDEYLSGGSLTTDAVANMSYTIENPFTDYVKSVMWVPGVPSDAALIASLYMGRHQFTYAKDGVSSHAFNPAGKITLSASFDIPQHPIASTRGTYMNTAPYTDTYLLLPRLGLVPVDNSLFANSSNPIRVDLQLDPISGMGVYILYVDGTEMSRWSGKIGVNVALSETKDIGESLNAYLSAVNPAASLISGDIAGAITGAGAAITSIARARETGGGTIGSNDGWLGLMGEYRRPHLISVFHQVAPDDNNHNGRPLCQVRQISTLGGYIKVQDGDVAIPGTSGEAAAVRSYLEGGFYYE